MSRQGSPRFGRVQYFCPKPGDIGIGAEAEHHHLDLRRRGEEANNDRDRAPDRMYDAGQLHLDAADKQVICAARHSSIIGPDRVSPTGRRPPPKD